MKILNKFMGKVCLLFVLSIFVILFLPSNAVYANTDKFEDFSDLANLDISMNEDYIVSIDQVEALKHESTLYQEKAWNKFFNKYKGLLVGVSGVCTLTFVLMFLISFAKIGKSSNNSQERSKAASSLLWLIIAAVGFGSLTFIMGLGFGLFNFG